MNELSELPVRRVHWRCETRPNGGGGLGALPQKILVVTCSEIDSNAIWLKK